LIQQASHNRRIANEYHESKQQIKPSIIQANNELSRQSEKKEVSPKALEWNDSQYQLYCSSPENKNSVRCSKFTIIMQTYDRDLLLQRLINHYATCPMVDRFVIVWNDIKRKPPFGQASFKLQPNQQLRIFEQKRNSMNNRFNLPHDFVRTDSVIIIDDDIMLDINALEAAFRVWRANPQKLVSFHRKFIQSNPNYPFRCEYAQTRLENEPSYEWFYRYDHVGKCKFKNGTKKHYDDNKQDVRPVVLVGTTFIHRTFLDMYNQHIPKELRELVDETMNCDDLVMAFSHAMFTKLVPIHIISKRGRNFYQTLENTRGHFKGLSSNPDNHLRIRTECIRRIIQVYGTNPIANTVETVALP
jgi:glucuronyl/N-acetylglucosaminyl transferase EXT2